MADEYWKTKSYLYDDRPNTAFQQHLSASKDTTTITKKQTKKQTQQSIVMMLKRGNAIAQITNGTNNTALDEKKEIAGFQLSSLKLHFS